MYKERKKTTHMRQKVKHIHHYQIQKQHMIYVNGYKTKRYTTQKIYININVYQTNSPPKLVTSKTFFLLT